jgi:predicted outer membrane protein
MFKYKIIETNEDPMESIIEKSGVTTKFTPNQVIEHLVHTRKKLKESEGQLFANDFQDKIVEEMIPSVKAFTLEELQMIMMYAARKVQRPELESFINTCKETIESYTSQVETINKALKLNIEIPVEVERVKKDEQEGIEKDETVIGTEA